MDIEETNSLIVGLYFRNMGIHVFWNVGFHVIRNVGLHMSGLYVFSHPDHVHQRSGSWGYYVS
jgi:hypothetical protein